MLTSKRIDLLCLAAIVLAVALTVGCFGMTPQDSTGKDVGYEHRLFDTSKVHTIDIVIDDWDGFIETCSSEEYSLCSVVIDGESFRNVGIRGKGNTSLSSVASMDTDRYSFKLEFDHYTTGGSYYGLDKLSLNNLIYDNTMMKDYLVYRMMLEFDAPAPLCSFVYITVNGEDHGLYLAAEGVEDSFLQRNYGADHGELYKPDTMNFGGGRGNGKDFKMDAFAEQNETSGQTEFPEMPQKFDPGEFPAKPAAAQDKQMPQQGFDRQGGPGGMGASDVMLQYVDDNIDSYSNIFDSAKTDVTDLDKTRLIAALKTLSNENAEDAVNVQDVMRYFVVHNFAVNGDSYTGSMIHNYYLYEENGKLSMLPWDYNLAFGTFQGASAESSINDPIDTPLSCGASDRPMIDWILQDPQQLSAYHEYFSQFLDQVDIQQIIEQAAELIAPYVEKDPTKFCTYEEFETGVSTLKEFCRLRSESIRGQLDGVIPSTKEGQNENASALIKSSLNTSDMGSMGMGGGRGGMQKPSFPQTDGERPEQFLPTQGGSVSSMQPPTQQPPQDQMPADTQMRRPNSAEANASAWYLLAGSAVLLLIAIAAATKYKRKR